MKDSGEIFAQFTLSRIRASLKDEPLTPGQIDQIHRVLVASERAQQHSVDVRLYVPAIFRSYYFILFAGRDRRKRSLELNRIRLSRTSRFALRTLVVSTVMLSSFVLAVLVFWGLYRLKSALGIDLVPGFHLSNWISEYAGDSFGESK